MKVRPAVRDDAGRLADLSRQLGYPSSETEIAGRLERLGRDPRHAVYVAEMHGEAAGWIHVQINEALEIGEFAEIIGLVVDEKRRSAGLGQILVEAAKDWSRKKGFRSLRVRSNVKREAAHRFYLRQGFVETKRSVVFEWTEGS